VAVSANIQVYGIKEALKELNKIDKSLRREITRDYKEIVKSVIDDAKAAVPAAAPLSGMNRRWKTKSGYEIIGDGGWSQAIAQKFLVAKISTRRVKEYQGNKVNVGTFRLVWSGIANQTFDIAGRKSSNPLARALSERWGSASRVMWPSYEKNKSQVDDEMLRLCERVMDEVNRNLVTAPVSRS
jgi:hypothetical protein